MDTKTCEICKCSPSEDNAVELTNLTEVDPNMVSRLMCDMCCAEVAALLDVLDVLK